MLEIKRYGVVDHFHIPDSYAWPDLSKCLFNLKAHVLNSGRSIHLEDIFTPDFLHHPLDVLQEDHRSAVPGESKLFGLPVGHKKVTFTGLCSM